MVMKRAAPAAMLEALNEVNRTLKQDPFLGGFEQEIRIGIGLGRANIGRQCGSDQRFNYSVMGDTVNVAARLEGQTKDYAQTILIGETTYQDAQAAVNTGRPPIAFLEMDLIALKGKALPERILPFWATKKWRKVWLIGHSKKLNRHFWLSCARLGCCRKVSPRPGHAYPELADYYEMLENRIKAYQVIHPGQIGTGILLP